MRFDNEIPELKILIEVHGPQHFQIIKNKNWLKDKTPEEWLSQLQWRDNYKRAKAIEQGYNYLWLSYKEIQSEEYKNIINNFIDEVRKNGFAVR